MARLLTVTKTTFFCNRCNDGVVRPPDAFCNSCHKYARELELHNNLPAKYATMSIWGEIVFSNHYFVCYLVPSGINLSSYFPYIGWRIFAHGWASAWDLLFGYSFLRVHKNQVLVILRLDGRLYEQGLMGRFSLRPLR